MIEAVTDNATRTVAEVRHKMSRGGGTIGTPNSVGWMFEKLGQIVVAADAIGEDEMMELALELGAEDFRREDDQFIITTSANDFHPVKSAIETRNVLITEAELAMVPKSSVKVSGKDAAALLKLLEELEDLDDVQKVWANFDIDVEEMVDG
jgi:YebC/PmpR family DNA-binding regulatory protein